jgi:hypothetical protein
MDDSLKKIIINNHEVSFLNNGTLFVYIYCGLEGRSHSLILSYEQTKELYETMKQFYERK